MPNKQQHRHTQMQLQQQQLQELHRKVSADEAAAAMAKKKHGTRQYLMGAVAAFCIVVMAVLVSRFLRPSAVTPLDASLVNSSHNSLRSGRGSASTSSDSSSGHSISGSSSRSSSSSSHRGSSNSATSGTIPIHQTEVHRWAATAKREYIPPVSSWPLPPPAKAGPFTVFTTLQAMEAVARKPSVEWLIAQLKVTWDKGECPLPLQLYLWQLVAYADKGNRHRMRNFFAKLIVDTGLINDVNEYLVDYKGSDEYTLLHVMVDGATADGVVASTLMRAGASPNMPMMDDNTAIHLALHWQERAYHTLHGAPCATNDFQFGVMAAKMLGELTMSEILAGVNVRGESVVLTGVLSRSKAFFRDMRLILLTHGESSRDLVHELVNMPDQVGRTPLIAAANPHSVIILASKVLTRHGNVGAIDPTGRMGCQIDQLQEMGLYFPSKVTIGGIAVLPQVGSDAAGNVRKIIPAAGTPKDFVPIIPDDPAFDEDDDGPSPAVYRSAAVRDLVHDWSVEFIDILIELGADLNRADKEGLTPLHAAAYGGNVPVLRRLLEKGAVVKTDAAGRFPADIAAARGFTRAVAELRKHEQAEGGGGGKEQRKLCFPTHCPELTAWAVRKETKVPSEKTKSRDKDNETKVEQGKGTSIANNNDNDKNSSSTSERGWRIGPAVGEPHRCDVMEVGHLTLQEFKESFWKHQQPVIVRGAVNPDDLDAFAKIKVLREYGIIPLQAADTWTGQRSHSYEISLEEYLQQSDALHALLYHGLHDASVSRNATAGTVVEVRDSNFFLQALSQFVRDHVPLARYPEHLFKAVTPWTLSNFQLNAGTFRSCTAIHFHEAAVNFIFAGRKRWLLFPPAHAFYSTDHALDWLREIPPLLRVSQRPLECVQNAGDAIFIPAGWAHGVIYEGETLGIGVLYNGGLVNAT